MNPENPHWRKLVEWAQMRTDPERDLAMPAGFSQKLVRAWADQRKPSIEEIWEKLSIKGCFVAMAVVMLTFFLAHQPSTTSVVYDYTMANAELSNIPWP